ncbi:MAG: hypothetical protein RRY33_08120 [Alistipes sp.]
MTIQETLQAMQRQGYNPVRAPKVLSWGNHTECANLFKQIMMAVDQSIKSYKHLPEYDDVIDWMTDTKGKGLLLMGDCGRGKSIITTGVIPFLLTSKGFTAKPIHADFFETPCKADWATEIQKPKNLDYLCQCAFPIIDELGVEPKINDYGERYEGFTKVINVAEIKLKPLFVSTNLNKEQLLARYDVRTFERLVRLCRKVEFKGESLRQ